VDLGELYATEHCQDSEPGRFDTACRVAGEQGCHFGIPDSGCAWTGDNVVVHAGAAPGEGESANNEWEAVRPTLYDMKEFITEWNKIAVLVHNTAIDKGWWQTDRNNGEMLALIHSEISEALEALRHGNLPDDKIPGFSGLEAELADAVIRIMDMGVARGCRMPEAIVAKMVYNETRPIKYGGKEF